jgi:Carboxypeptidase regulatory-like domain
MLRRSVRLSAVLLIAGFSASPQSETRSVTGVVTDLRGNALRGAAVQLENIDTLSIVSYITGPDGRYHFSGLHDYMDYALKAKYRSWWSKKKTLSRFNSSKCPEVDLVVPTD